MCPVCRLEPGSDCADKGKDKRTCKRIEALEWMHEVLEEMDRRGVNHLDIGPFTDLITFPEPSETGTVFIRMEGDPELVLGSDC